MTVRVGGHSGGLRARRGPLRKTSAWAVLAFSIVIIAAYSSSVMGVFNLLSDYDALALKPVFFYFHNEAVHLLSIARPVAALLSNFPVIPVQSPEDFRWIHLFSLLTICILGAQVIANCIGRLRVNTWDAVAVALAIFLGLAFIYPVFESTAWTPHLLSPLLAFWAYAILGRSNAQAFAFLGPVTRHDYDAVWRQLPGYVSLRPVWTAFVIFQLALYDYPPFALLVLVFPVIAILFSRARADMRAVIALRDMLFAAACLLIYFLSTMLVYLPIVRLFTAKGQGAAGAYDSEYVAGLYVGHQFTYNTDPWAVLQRLKHLMVVSGDLWFLPQANMHVVTGILLVAAIVLVNVRLPGRSTPSRLADDQTSVGRLKLDSFTSDGVIVVLVVLGCFLMAASPILASSGGFVAYRTAVATTAIVALVLIFSISCIAEALARMAGRWANAGGAAMALAIGAAFSANAYANYVIMKLGRNEYIYYESIVRRAIADKSHAIVLIDSRPWAGARNYNPWPVSDLQGRAVPPFELGCFSSYCRQTGSIVRVISAELGASPLELVLTRGDDPVPGLTCEMLTGATPSYPPTASQRSIALVDRYRALAPLTCVSETTPWHDLGFEPKR